MKDVFREIHRRNLWQVLGIYLAASWLVLQVIDVVADNMGLPEWIWPAGIVLLLLGLPIVLATAFVQKGIGPSRPTARPFADPMETALASTETGGEPAAATAAPPPPAPQADGVEHRLFTWRNALLGGAGAFLLLFGFAGLYVVIQDRGRSFAPEEAVAEEADPGIAVLPFSVTGPDVDFWREGMAQSLALNLDGLAGLRTIDSRTVLSRWNDQIGDEPTPDLEEALEVARATGASYAVLGDLVSTGSRLQAWAEVYDLETGEQLDRVQVEGSAAPDSTFGIVNRLALGTLQVIPQAQRADAPPIDLARLTTDSIAALRSFLEGEAHFRDQDYTPAIDAYTRAVTIDSTFALAHYRLSLANGWRDNASGRDQHDEKAVQFSERLSERSRLLVRAHLFYSEGLAFDAARAAEEVTRRYPDEMEGWYLLGETIDHLGSQLLLEDPMGEAARALERVAELDPGFQPGQEHRVEAAFARGDSAAVRELLTLDWSEHSINIPGYRLADRIAFATEAERQTALAALDTASVATRRWSVAALGMGHPPSLARQGEALDRAKAGGFADDIAAFWWFPSRLKQGRIADLSAELDRSDELGSNARTVLLSAHFAGLPVPESTLDRALESDFPGAHVWLAGAYYAEQDRRTDLKDWNGRVDAARDDRLAEGDSSTVESADRFRRLVVALDNWKQEPTPAAADSLVAMQRLAVGWSGFAAVNEVARWWVADALAETGRTDEAEPYLRSLLQGTLFQPVATERLAQLYDERGELEKAAEHYAIFIELWGQADPELQARVEAARARLEEILRERG